MKSNFVRKNWLSIIGVLTVIILISAIGLTSFAESIGEGPKIEGRSKIEKPLKPEGLSLKPPSTSIDVDRGKVLILGPENKYIIKDHNGEDTAVVTEQEWALATNTYNENTSISLLENANDYDPITVTTTAYIYTTMAAKIAVIKTYSGFANLVILANSDITVDTKGADIEGVNVSNLNILQNAKITVTAKNTAVKVKNSVYMFGGAVLNANSTNPEEVLQTATVFIGEMIETYDAIININSQGGPYGLRLGEYPELAPYESGYASFSGGSISATTKTGRAISAGSNINIVGGKLTGIATEGSAGIHSTNISGDTDENGNPSTIFGKAAKGFGVVAQSIDNKDTEFPYGNLSASKSSLVGEVDEGIGISSNTTSFIESNVLGVANKGIGISLCMLQADSNTIIKGVSHGETSEHFQVYDAIPDSCGISSLSYNNISNNVVITGLAPKDIKGSIGISAYLPDEKGNVSSGGLSLTQYATVTAVGDIGIRSFNIQSYGDLEENPISINIEATSLGVKTSSMYLNNTDLNVIASGDDSNGVLVEVFGESSANSINFNLDNTNLNITAGRVGFSLTAENDYINELTIRNSKIFAKATSENSLAGFSVKVTNEMQSEYPAPPISLTDSSLEGESNQDGIIFNRVNLSTTHLSGTEELGIVGIGGETGIHFLNITGDPSIVSDNIGNANIFTIKGVSKSLAPDIVGRKPAIVLGSNTDGSVIAKGNVRVLEEYQTKATEALSVEEKYLAYADGMNSTGMGGGVWNDPDNWRYTATRHDLDVVVGQGASTNDSGRDLLVVGNMEPGLVDFDPSTQSYYEIVLKADANLMEVAFNTDQGQPVPPSQQLFLGDQIVKPENPTKVGHNFIGWTYPDIDTLWDFNNPVLSAPMTLVAKWQRVGFITTFDSGEGEPKTQQTTSQFGEKINPPEKEPKRRLHKFLGWHKDKELTIPFDFLLETMPTNDITVYGKWEKTHYEVSFNAGGGDNSTLPKTMEVEIGKPVVLFELQPGKAKAPKYTGHFLLGWKNGEGQNVIADFNMPAKDVTLTANWISAKGILILNPNSAVVGYKNEITKEKVEQDLVSRAQYTDYLGITHNLEVFKDWNQKVLKNGGVEKITTYILDSSGTKVFPDKDSYVYILNKPYIGGSNMVSFNQHDKPLENGKNWSVYGFKELPDFTNKTINRIPLQIEFVSNGFTTELDGTYYPYFSVKDTDYFNNPITLKHTVSALVFPFDLGGAIENQHQQGNSDFWIEASKTLHLSKFKESWHIDGKTYKQGGTKKENLPATEIFDRLLVAEPFMFLKMSSEPLQILKEQKNSRLIVKQGFINWYFDSEDFHNQKYEPTGFYDLDVNAKSTDQLKQVGKNGSSMELHFELNKYFFGKGTLNIKVNQLLLESAKKGNTLYFFNYNDITKELEIIDRLKATTDGFYYVKLSGVFKDYIILDHLPGGKPKNSSGSSSPGESGEDEMIYRITDKTNPLDEELKKDIEDNLKLKDKTIEQITVLTPGSLEEQAETKSNLPVILGSSAALVAGLSTLIWLFAKKRKDDSNQEIYR